MLCVSVFNLLSFPFNSVTTHACVRAILDGHFYAWRVTTRRERGFLGVCLFGALPSSAEAWC